MTESAPTTDAEVLARVKQIVAQAFVGVLTTVDDQNHPHGRWMGAVLLGEDFGKLYTLSGPHARKLTQIRANPRVSWVFNIDGYGEIVSLHGKAEIHTSPVLAQNIWDRLATLTRDYAMSVVSDDSDSLDMVVIETEVDEVEWLSPKRRVFKPRIAKASGATAG